jgi:hypothetical protein
VSDSCAAKFGSPEESGVGFLNAADIYGLVCFGVLIEPMFMTVSGVNGTARSLSANP